MTKQPVPAPKLGTICMQLRADYPTGLAATEEVASNLAHPPRAFAQAYILNMYLDRDHDGIICARAH